MDYLDPRRELRHNITMLIGYVLVAVAIVFAALILLYQAYGFGIGKNGTVIQNGLTFFSSHPSGADIYVNGSIKSVKTNTRLALPANVYHIKLSRAGYHDWQRTINLDGGSVEHFDYPFLFPSKLVTKNLSPALNQPPAFVTQSSNMRWLIMEQPGSASDFTVRDLKNPNKAPEPLVLPDGVLTKATDGESLQLQEWADDNQHFVLQHTFDNKVEFILVDRTDPVQAINLNTALDASPAKLTLNNKKYDRYYLYDAATAVLQTASLKNPIPVTALEHVLSYKSYSDNTILYATNDKAPAGKVFIRLLNSGETSDVRTLPAESNYLLELTKYSGTIYVVVAATNEGKVYIYRDPIGQLHEQPGHVAVPTQVLRLPQPNYLSFSNNAQFIVTENGSQFGVYDIENKLPYSYISNAPLDAPQAHATWMDGNRLTYVSGGKLFVTDYDNRNHQTLMPADSSYLPFFAPDYKYVYAITPGNDNQSVITQTALLAPADL